MSDRELLEKAAKAAGYEFVRHSECGDGVLLSGIQDAWRPLVDDADAFRLAVKVGLIVNATDHAASADGFRFMGQAGERDPYAATRRAIVRAAASLAEKE